MTKLHENTNTVQKSKKSAYSARSMSGDVDRK